MYSRDISDLYAAAERNKLDQSVDLMNESRSKSNNRAKNKLFIQASQEMLGFRLQICKCKKLQNCASKNKPLLGFEL